jgi:hypothetical protein
MNKEREDSSERYEEIEKVNENLRSGSSLSVVIFIICFLFSVESTNDIESVREFYINVVNELNQQVSNMKAAYEQIDAEKQRLADELEKQAIEIDPEQSKQMIGMIIIFYKNHDDKRISVFRKSAIGCIETTISRGLFRIFVVYN